MTTDPLQKCCDAILQATIPFKDDIDCIDIDWKDAMKGDGNGDGWQHAGLTRISNISIKITPKIMSANACSVEAAKEELGTVWEECRHPNWDGHGALPIVQDTLRNTNRFLESLPCGTPFPSIGAEPDGALTLEWYRSPRHLLSISVHPDGQVHYAALLGPNRAYGTEVFLDEVPERILGLVRQVHQHD